MVTASSSRKEERNKEGEKERGAVATDPTAVKDLLKNSTRQANSVIAARHQGLDITAAPSVDWGRFAASIQTSVSRLYDLFLPSILAILLTHDISAEQANGASSQTEHNSR